MYPLLGLFYQRIDPRWARRFVPQMMYWRPRCIDWRRKYQHQRVSIQGEVFVEVTPPTMGLAAPVEVTYSSATRDRLIPECMNDLLRDASFP